MLLPVLGRGIWRPAIFALLFLTLSLAWGYSQIISGGLATSTLLTLLVVPAGYSFLEVTRSRRKKKRYAR